MPPSNDATFDIHLTGPDIMSNCFPRRIQFRDCQSDVHREIHHCEFAPVRLCELMGVTCTRAISLMPVSALSLAAKIAMRLIARSLCSFRGRAIDRARACGMVECNYETLRDNGAIQTVVSLNSEWICPRSRNAGPRVLATLRESGHFRSRRMYDIHPLQGRRDPR